MTHIPNRLANFCSGGGQQRPALPIPEARYLQEGLGCRPPLGPNRLLVQATRRTPRLRMCVYELLNDPFNFTSVKP